MSSYFKQASLGVIVHTAPLVCCAPPTAKPHRWYSLYSGTLTVPEDTEIPTAETRVGQG